MAVAAAAASDAGKSDDGCARTATFVRGLSISDFRESLHTLMSDASIFGANPQDGRAQAQRAAEQRAQERAEQLELQSSSLSTPEERIRLWEKLHMLSLPRASTHPLLSHIASQTALTLAQVQDEQRRRAMPIGEQSR